MSWSIHHVNLQTKDVRKTAAFYTSVLGMSEGEWVLPESAGYIPVSPDRLALFDDPSRDGQAAGLHLIKPDPDFARKNGFKLNPSVGGHFAIQVSDMNAVIKRLQAANIPFDDAGEFAIPGLWNIYFRDPEGTRCRLSALFRYSSKVQHRLVWAQTGLAAPQRACRRGLICSFIPGP